MALKSSQPAWLEVGVPTLERPFGLALWPIFEKAFESLKGYKPQDFRFVRGTTPLSTFGEIATMLLSYYLIIFGGREVMRNFSARNWNGLFKIHNFYLTVISSILLALFAEQLIPVVWRKGVFFAICHADGGWTDKMVILYYVCNSDPETTFDSDLCKLNYLTKFLELIDTVFLFLKKKPLSTATIQFTWMRLMLRSVFAHLPSRRHGTPLLHPIGRTHCGLMGSDNGEFDGACRHVLVLLPERTRHSCLVETVYHDHADRSVCCGPRWENLSLRLFVIN